MRRPVLVTVKVEVIDSPSRIPWPTEREARNRRGEGAQATSITIRTRTTPAQASTVAGRGAMTARAIPGSSAHTARIVRNMPLLS